MGVAYHDVPIIDLSCNKSLVAELVVKASEDYGFFMVINHGVCKDVIDRMEQEGLNFFAKPISEKRLAGPPNPFGYGTKNIGSNGDTGEVEYLLLNNDPQSIFQTSKSISNNPKEINSCVVNDYMEAVRNLACEILDLMTEGLHVNDNKSALSSYIRGVDCDSLIRLNHYPPYKGDTSSVPSSHSDDQDQQNIVGFGEHSDPQILTLLRSNDVGGLQILLEDEMWVPIPPDPMAFCVNVGDTLQ
ncbi:gibberellin 2-beta-dioxygenase 2-like, partial [Thalictrum thalictroides]